MRIRGTAPDALRFEMGIVGGEPFEVYEGPYRVLPGEAGAGAPQLDRRLTV